MLDLFLPSSVARLVVYLKPVSVRLGPDKIRELCRGKIGIAPSASTAFIVANKKQDCLLMFVDDDGAEQTPMKKLTRGAFLLTASGSRGKDFVIMRPSMSGRLFRSDTLAGSG